MSAIKDPTLEACSWCHETFADGQKAIPVRVFGKSGESSWYYEACGEACAEVIETVMTVNRRGM